MYTFLNRSEAVTRRRASTFRVSASDAAKKLDFDLGNFPRELVASLAEVERSIALVRLRFSGIAPTAGPVDWSRAEASAAWRAVSPRWDNDFSDDGFHRALSYAHTVLSPDDEEACAPDSDSVVLRPRLPQASRHRVISEAGRDTLSLTTTHQVFDQEPVPVAARVDALGFSLSIHLFRDEPVRRDDRDGWLRKRLGLIGPSSTDAYLTLVTELAEDYRRRLDVVAPVMDHESETGRCTWRAWK